MADSTNQLLTLAHQEFGRLTNADKKLFYAIARHEVADFKAGKEGLNNPEAAEQWGTERTLKADRLVWLLTTPKVVEFLSFRGLRIFGAKIDGELNLEYATVSVPLIFDTCAFTEPLILQKSKLKALELKRTHVSEIKAEEMQVEGSVSLCDGFVAKGEVNLIGASIGGQLSCSGGKFRNQGQTAINANTANITTDVFLRNGFEAEGEVILRRASIGASMEIYQLGKRFGIGFWV